MANFQYIALDAKGEQTTGVVQANSDAEAVQALRGQGLYPTQVVQEGKGSLAKTLVFDASLKDFLSETHVFNDSLKGFLVSRGSTPKRLFLMIVSRNSVVGQSLLFLHNQLCILI